MKSESLIVKFFEKTLTTEELHEFNKLMANDSDFRKEVEFRNELKDVITLDDRETIKHELKDLESNIPKKNIRIWPIAASLVILLGVSSFWFFGNQTANSEDLFNTNFEPYRNVVQPIERGNDTTDPKIDAFIAYESKDYDNALKGFNMLAEDNDAVIQFYKANTLLKLGNTDEAIRILKQNITLTDTLTEKHYWYLALAYIKADNFEEAKEKLKYLINNPNSEYKKEEAKKLTKKLK